ncbi:MAG: hypothetical protein AAGA99_19020 [Actinomycetota bacterium]
MSLTLLVGTVADAGTVVDLADGTSLRMADLRTAQGPINLVWPAERRLPDLADGEEVVVVGSVRRRFFRAGGRTVGVTEVMAETAVRRRRRRAVERALEAAWERAALELPSR